MSSANRDSLTSFLICIFLIFLSYQLGNTSSINIEKDCADGGHPCFTSNFSWIVSIFSSFRRMMTVGFLYITFIVWRHAPSRPMFSRIFIMSVCQVLPMAFSAPIEMIVWFLSWSLFTWFMFIDLCMLSHSCISEITLTCLTVGNPFDVYLYSVFCLPIFYCALFMSIRAIVLSFSFCRCPCGFTWAWY